MDRNYHHEPGFVVSPPSVPRERFDGVGAAATSANLAGGRTQQLFGQVASLLFNFAVDNDYCETNPASRMKRGGRIRRGRTRNALLSRRRIRPGTL